MIGEMSIQPMMFQDLDELVALHAQYLNYGSGIYHHFQQVLSDPDTVAVKCVHNGRIIGLDIYTRGVALSGGHAELCAEIRGIAADEVVYTGDALLVVPEFRRQGLDRAMLNACREQLRERCAIYVLYELWVHPDGSIPAHHTVEHYEQKIDLGLHPNFYVDFDHYGYFCPICGGKCKCSAQLYLCRVA